MKVKDLIGKLLKLDPEKYVYTQVVAEDGSTWNCILEINDIKLSDIVQLRVSHPELKTLRERVYE